MTQNKLLSFDDQDRIAVYREIQRSIPGLDEMYQLMHAQIVRRCPGPFNILIVGAGGGREIGALGAEGHPAQITALDISPSNLEIARSAVRGTAMSDRTEFFEGTVADLPSKATFDVATSMLVMHAIPDDGAKLEYLKNIQARLCSTGFLIHADICFDSHRDFKKMIPSYLAHASKLGISSDATLLELEAIPELAVTTGERISDLFIEAGFSKPQEIFRSLWYRCWVGQCAKVGKNQRIYTMMAVE